jgi:hypothetical protein
MEEEADHSPAQTGKFPILVSYSYLCLAEILTLNDVQQTELHGN